MEGENRNDEPRYPYVSPLLPHREQQRMALPKGSDYTPWYPSSVSDVGYVIAILGALLMTYDLLQNPAGVSARFALAPIWGPIVGCTALVIAWRGCAWIRTRRTYRSR